MAAQDLSVPNAPAAVPNRLTMLSGLSSQPAVQRALPAIGVVGAVALAGAAWWSFQTPAQVPLFQGLAESDKAAVATALQAAGITYSFDRDSGTLDVDEDKIHKARMILAGQGLPKAAPGGDAMIAAMPMGSSRAVEGQTLRGAREADLARTIEAIDSVKSARIHLATPEISVFVRDKVAPAASVMLTLQPGRTLSLAQVRAMRHLVASSVPGLSPEQVSVIDQSGALLSQAQDTAPDPIFTRQLQMEDRYREALIALLTPMFGRENFSVEVHADVNAEESQSTRETYPKDDRALRREEGNKSTDASAPATPGLGIPGVLSNQPPQATQVATTPGAAQAVPGSTTASQSAETYARNFEVGREISVTHKPQGRLSRLSVAVAIRNVKGAKALSSTDTAALETLVKGAVGFDATRGDVVAITARSFSETVAAPVSWTDAPWLMPVIRQVGGILVALLVLLFLGRPLLKMFNRKSAALPAAEIERQLLAATTPRGGAAAPKAITLDMLEAASSYEARADLVRTFVAQDTDRAALIVRQLVKEGKNGR